LKNNDVCQLTAGLNSRTSTRLQHPTIAVVAMHQDALAVV
jgi:hypothetical protein